MKPMIRPIGSKWLNGVTNVLLEGRRPSNPITSTYLWRGRVATNLPVGEHTIEVKATDMFGRYFVQEKSYSVEVR